MSDARAAEPVKFGTFTGVFTPTLLTILGVIMYVRIGWVVGNAGLGGALAILALGLLITTCTGLSLSSIATNTRIGAGGPYAILNKSLGVEVGGAIGIPLYLTRPLGVAMYIFGLREGLLWALQSLPWLPTPPALAIDVVAFGLLWGLAYRSADLAFKTQYVIMGVIALSLVSIFGSPAAWTDPVAVEWWGDYRGAPEDGFQGADFWVVFAVFFPATTGILAGANMSGDLSDPRRSIPRGTLAAIALSTVIYFAVAWICARVGTLDQLTEDYDHLINQSLFPPLVAAGLLGATASSALAGLVGGPRILMAMGEQRVVPFSEALSRTVGGEPRAASAVTGVLTLGCIMLRDLNAIAPLVTMFFLITYCMINVVVLLEGTLGFVSYRPTLRVPRVVPAAGLVGCVFSMFIVNPTFSLISVVMVLALYAYMRSVRPQEAESSQQVRSAIFLGLAEWAAARVTPEDMDNTRAWKPHLLVPVEDAEDLRGSLPMLRDLARPEGSIKLMGLATQHPPEALLPRLEDIGRSLRERGEWVFWNMVNIQDYGSAVNVGVMALQGAFFTPNLLFARVHPEDDEDPRLVSVIRTASETRVGVVLLSLHPAAGLGEMRDIRLWVRPAPGWDPDEAFSFASLDLTLLMGYRLWRLWGGRLHVAVVARDPSEAGPARRFLDQLCDLARFPDEAQREVFFGAFEACAAEAGVVDVSIFGMQRDPPDLPWCRRMTQITRGSCLFLLDSGRESARA
ncbi:MAG: hypothetical protein H6741_17650 [Alphaproteobacteria bacterium]|nr:hypothetical protein [Alphaproteobacteria bacterium]MCB9794544.1 hypothetical protein [Alphaproteobacteria bacterium]